MSRGIFFALSLEDLHLIAVEQAYLALWCVFPSAEEETYLDGFLRHKATRGGDLTSQPRRNDFL